MLYGKKNGYARRMLDLIEDAGGRVIFEPELRQNRDELYERVLTLYPDMRVEMDEEGNIVIMPPASLESGFGSGEVFGQLRSWAKRDGTGRACDATGTYNLPTGAKMAPDASWISNSVLGRFGKAARSTVTGLVVCPAFVIEVRSPSDRLNQQINKCERWLKAGVQEAWLVDPLERTVRIFLTGKEPLVLNDPSHVESSVLPGFLLECQPVWE